MTIRMHNHARALQVFVTVYFLEWRYRILYTCTACLRKPTWTRLFESVRAWSTLHLIDSLSQPRVLLLTCSVFTVGLVDRFLLPAFAQVESLGWASLQVLIVHRVHGGHDIRI